MEKIPNEFPNLEYIALKYRIDNVIRSSGQNVERLWSFKHPKRIAAEARTGLRMKYHDRILRAVMRMMREMHLKNVAINFGGGWWTVE